jgi:hypothetical protein
MTKKIDVGKINGNFYGGLPYTASWNFNDGGNPSTLNVSVVNSMGVYPNIDGDLTYNKKVTVSLGSLNFVGYLVGYNIEKTPEQKILNLEYVDASADLERYYVGLYKRHGLKTGDSKNLIIVGKEYNPCDTDRDSTVSAAETSSSAVIDPCDPCPYMPDDKYKSSCDQARTDFQIWEVYYTFNDLISQLPVSVLGNAADVNLNFRAQHTGTLKSVLSAWCSDLGLAYYWDPFQGGIVFVDRSKPILAPRNLENTDNIIDYKFGASKKNTFSRGFIGYIAKQGEFKSYKCETTDVNSFQTVSPLTVGDLLNAQNYTAVENEVAFKEISCAMSRFGKPLRDAYIWFEYYKITGAQAAKQIVYDSTTSSGSRNIITPLGKMKILRVYHPSLSDANSGEFPSINRQVIPNEYKAMEDTDKKAGLSADNPSWYYFVAEVDDELADSQFKAEENIGKNFMGKYWYKYYNTPIPGADNAHTQVTTDTPDGSNAKFYISRGDLAALELFGFGHEQGSNIDRLAKKTTEDTKDGVKLAPQTKLTSAQSFLLVDRPIKFLPTDDQIKDYDALFKWYQEYTPQMMGTDGRPDIIYSLWPEAKNNKNVRLFMARQYDQFKVGYESARHPLEPNSMTIKTKTQEDGVGNQVVTNIGSYGLINNNCVKLTIGSGRSDSNDISKTDIVIYTPPQSLNINGLSSGGGYVVFAQPSADFPKILPKVQYTLAIPAAETDVARLDYNYKEIQEENLNLITNSRTCRPSESQLSTYANEIGKSSAYSMAEVQNTVSIKLPGIVPEIFGINQALNSIQINISENSSYTTYNFEDKIIQRPGEEYITQYILDKAKGMRSLGANSFTTAQANQVSIGMRGL